MITTSNEVLAVACQHACAIVFLDLETGDRIDTLSLDYEPHELAFDPTRRLIYATHTYHSGWYFGNAGRVPKISVIDADTHKLVDVIDISPFHGPHDVFCDPHNDLVFTTVEGSDGGAGGVLVLDAATHTISDHISVEAIGPHWFSANSDVSKIFVAAKESSFAAVVDVKNRTMTGRVELPGTEGIAVLPGDDRIVVAAPVMVPAYMPAPSEPYGLRVIDAATLEVTDVLASEVQPMAVHVTTGGALLVSETPMRHKPGADPYALPEFPDGHLRVYEPGTLELRGRVPIGPSVLTVRSSPDGKHAFASSLVSANVTVVDIDSLDVIHTIPVEKGAHGMTIIPAA
ncbi:YncE family protein [Nocardia sp. CA-128927]|uniref:YncE family protein n=1 Tax=Nocardia sp. CA-128927 TaxID=3239975 RepID=UPI003D95C40B